MKFLRFLCFPLVIMLTFTACHSSKKIASGSLPSRNSSMSDAASANQQVFKGASLAEFAELLQVDKNALKNKQLYHFISDWLGSPHQMGGMNKQGVDCSGFVNLLYKEVYAQPLARSSAAMGEQVKRKYEEQLVEGDLIFFSFGGKAIDHVGVYLHRGKFVHVSTRKGVIISDLKDRWYYPYFTRGGNLKGQ